MRKIRIGVFVGSFQKNSYTRLVVKMLHTLAPECLELEFIDIGNLAMYNHKYDDEGTPPLSWILFREAAKKLDVFLFVTPEYNRSVPGMLKNALDVGSRPYGQSVWAEKPGAVISVSPGAIGAYGSNRHLRPPLCDAKALISDETHECFQAILDAYVIWIDKNLSDARCDAIGNDIDSKNGKTVISRLCKVR